MKILQNKKLAALLILLCTTTICIAQQKEGVVKPAVNPEEQALKKLFAIATNAADNGLKLVDTISPNNKYLVTNASTVPFPSAIGTVISFRSTSYKGNVADINYTWSVLIKKIPQADSLAFNKRIGQLQEIIARILPKVRDTFYIQKNYNKELIWEWELKKNHKLKLTALVEQKYNLPNEVKLQLTVNKSLKQDQKRITDSLFNGYSKLISEATSRKDATYYFLTLMKVLEFEGMPTNDILTKVKPIFKSIANNDMGAASNIMIACPQYALQAFQAELSPEQLTTLKNHAKNLVDNFNAKYYSKKTETQGGGASLVSATGKREDFNQYFTNAPTPSHTSKYIFVEYRDIDGRYKIQEVNFKQKSGTNVWFVTRRNLNQMISDADIDAMGGKWKAVHIGDCPVCQGTGIEITKTPYSYYYETKGIYNKYTYSGSGYKTGSQTCSLCNGYGYRIVKLQ